MSTQLFADPFYPPVPRIRRPRLMLFTAAPRQAIRMAALFAAPGSFDLMGAPANPADLPDAAGLERPEILLLDCGPAVTIGLISAVRQKAPDCRIVLWVDTLADDFAIQAQRCGIAGIVRRQTKDPVLLEKLLDIMRGTLVFERAQPAAESAPVRLSRRQGQIADLLAQGRTNKEIAGLLGITEGTVKSYLVHAFRKIGARDRFEIAALGRAQAKVKAAGASGADGHSPDGQ